MKHASLYTGIGGFDLAAEWMGWENIFQVENNEFCLSKLEKNFKNVKRYKDIREFNGTPYAKQIDILTGGFPCQSFSIAGKGTLDLTLWKEMYRVINEIKPPYVVAENVPGIVSRKESVAFESVCVDLENSGYEVQPCNLPIAGCGAPHRRERIWFIAYSDSFRCENEQEEKRQIVYNQKRNGSATEQIGHKQQRRISESDSNIANPNCIGLMGREFEIISTENGIKAQQEFEPCTANIADTTSAGFPGICKSEQRKQLLHVERGSWEESWVEVATRLCRMDARVPNRVDRIKALGNSISPHLALVIFKTINTNKII